MIQSLLVAGLYFFTPNAHGIKPDAVDKNKEGIEHLKAENSYLAYQSFVEALSHEPFRPELKLNLGKVFEINEEYDKSVKSSLSAKKVTDNKEVHFYAHFNAAVALGKDKKIDEALKQYQEALEINPNSEEAKINIELLMQNQGQGGGEGDQNQQQQDQQGNQPNQNPSQQPQQKKQKPKFDSKKLSKNDVRKILEEIKNQEQKIRAKEYDKSNKEQPNAKDW